jgi:predicted Zn finger-like uncharacterized protein
MAFCGKCGKPLKDGVQFCASCGTPVKKKADHLENSQPGVGSQTGKVCPQCGAPETNANARFCPKCGAPKEVEPRRVAIQAKPTVKAEAPVAPPAPLIVACPNCGTRYRVEASRFNGESEYRFKCPKCETTVTAGRILNPAPMPSAPTATSPGTPEGVPSQQSARPTLPPPSLSEQARASQLSANFGAGPAVTVQSTSPHKAAAQVESQHNSGVAFGAKIAKESESHKGLWIVIGIIVLALAFLGYRGMRRSSLLDRFPAPDKATLAQSLPGTWQMTGPGSDATLIQITFRVDGTYQERSVISEAAIREMGSAPPGGSESNKKGIWTLSDDGVLTLQVREGGGAGDSLDHPTMWKNIRLSGDSLSADVSLWMGDQYAEQASTWSRVPDQPSATAAKEPALTPTPPAPPSAEPQVGEGQSEPQTKPESVPPVSTNAQAPQSPPAKSPPAGCSESFSITPCDTAASPSDKRECWAAKYLESEQRLKNLYDELTRTLDDNQASQLREEERVWKVSRDANAETAASGQSNVDLADAARSESMTRANIERIRILCNRFK